MVVFRSTGTDYLAATGGKGKDNPCTRIHQVVQMAKKSVVKSDHVTSLKGARVHLRILERGDIPTTTKWMNSEYISDIMGYLPTMSLEQQYEWYDRTKNDRSRYIFAICQNKDARHIGNVAIGNVDTLHRHGMFSIFLAGTADQAKGIGSEATMLVLGFAFEKLNLNKVYLRTSPRFTQAIHMYDRLGFVREGVMREHSYANGKYEDKIMYSMLRKEYDRAVEEKRG